MSNPLISVLIPTYNVEKFVSEAIFSILNQTYTNIEVIIVDDGSKDKTYPILQSIAKTDTRIKLFRNDENEKIVKTLNTAYRHSTGAYIARMDGDDISVATRLEEQLAFLNEHQDIDLVGSNVVMIDEEGNEIHKQHYLYDFSAIKVAKRYFSPVNHIWLSKREVYEKVGPYRIPSVEDYDFILRAIDLGFKVSNSQKYLYYQRIRKGNTATSLGLTQRKSLMYVRNLADERFKSKSNFDSYSIEGLQDALKVSNFEKKRFEWSSKLHHQYVSTKKRSMVLALIFRLCSVGLAPVEQTKHIYERWKYKQLFK